jgi:hypothetical protein
VGTVVVTPLAVFSRVLSTATSTQRASLQVIQAAVPDARVVLHERMLARKGDAKAPRLRIVSVVVFKKVGPFTLRGEFLLPGTAACTLPSSR